jgi:hypothetical protein
VSRVTPDLYSVLAEVLPGRIVRLSLTDCQKRSLRDPDGRLALDVVRHLLGARRVSVAPSKPKNGFPLTGETFRSVAAKLGRRLTLKRCYLLINRLKKAGVIVSVGSYRQKYDTREVSGFRVILYWAATAAGASRPKSKASVGRRKRVKRKLEPRWWEHSLFGCPDSRPPPPLDWCSAIELTSLDERLSESRAAAWWAARASRKRRTEACP